MTAKNDHTGDLLQSRMNTKEYEENFDKIFGKKKSRIDTIGQNGNNGEHYEYELNKSTGEIEKRFTDGVSKPNESQFNNIKND